MSDRFWVGGTGNWSDDTNHWATTSGGAPGAGNLPTASDNAIFDAASNATAYTVTLNTAVAKVCNDLNFSAAPSGSGTITWAGSQSISISGSLTCLTGMTRTYTGVITFNATTTGKNITTNGVTLGGSIIFNGVGGEWTFQSNLNIGFWSFTITNGSINTNTKTISSGNALFGSAGVGSSLDISGTVWTYGGGGGWGAGTNLSLTVNTSTSIIANDSFSGGGKTYNDVTLSASAIVSLSGANTFRNLTCNGKNIVNITDNQIITGTFTSIGTSAGVRIALVSNTAGTPVTITAAAVSLTNVDFRDITGAGAASPFTGTRLGDAQGNSGITFPAGVNKFWVGNTNSWIASNVWATSSGGAGATNNYPLPQDVAVFDLNSFSANGQTTSIPTSFSNTFTFFGKIDFSGITKTITFSIVYDSCRFIGDLTLSANVTMSFGSSDNSAFMGRGTQTITSVGKSLGGSSSSLTIDSFNGTVLLADDFSVANQLTISSGIFDANGKNVTTKIFTSNNSNTRTVTMGSGTWTLTGNNATIWNVSGSNLTFTPGNPVVCNYSGATGTRTITNSSPNESSTPSFNITAGTDIVTFTGTGVKDINFTGFSGSLATAAAPIIFGNLTLSSGMTDTSGTAVITFANTSGTKTLTTNGITINKPVTMNGIGGTLQLADNLTMSSTRTLTITNGTLDTNNLAVLCGLFASNNSNTRILTLGSSTIELNGTSGSVWNIATSTGLTITSNTSTIKITGGGSSPKTFSGGDKTYNNIWLTGSGTGTFDFVGSNTFNDFKCDTPPHTMRFTAGSNTTVTTFTVSGTAGNLMTIGSITSSQHTLAKAGGGRIGCDYMSISRSTASPINTWYAGRHSTNGGNNVAWNFGDLPTPSTGFRVFF